MGYIWSNRERLTYDWPDWTRPWAAPRRWRNPVCDVGQERRVDETRVGSSVPIDWGDWAEVRINTNPPRQTPDRGSVNGQVVQSANPKRLLTVTVKEQYGGTLIVDGEPTVKQGPGHYRVKIPTPFRNGWGVEGFPNGENQGDRHLYLVEPDGTCHEMIGWWRNDRDPLLGGRPTCRHYAKYAPDGTVLHRIDPGGSVVKGQVQLTRLLWNRGDVPHRLGIVFSNLSAIRDDSIPDGIWRHGPHGSDGTRTDPFPAYGHWYRLSDQAFTRLYADATLECREALIAAHSFGFIPFDKGGAPMNTNEAGMGFVAGAQQEDSTLDQLDLRVGDLERVTAAA